MKNREINKSLKGTNQSGNYLINTIGMGTIQEESINTSTYMIDTHDSNLVSKFGQGPVELISSMSSNIKFVNNSIDSEDNPFVVKQQLDKIDEQGEVQMS